MHRRPRPRIALILSLGAAALLGVACDESSPTDMLQPEPESEILAALGESGDHGPRHGPLARLFRGIELTDAQKAEVGAIGLAYRPDMRAGRQDMRALFEAFIEARRDGDAERVEHLRVEVRVLRNELAFLRDRVLTQVRDVLTAEQQAVFDENLARLEEQGGPGGSNGPHQPGGHNGPPPGAHGGPDGHGGPGLTDEQRDRIKAIAAEYRPRLEAVRDEIRALHSDLVDAIQSRDGDAVERIRAEIGDRRKSAESVRGEVRDEVYDVLAP